MPSICKLPHGRQLNLLRCQLLITSVFSVHFFLHNQFPVFQNIQKRWVFKRSLTGKPWTRILIASYHGRGYGYSDGRCERVGMARIFQDYQGTYCLHAGPFAHSLQRQVQSFSSWQECCDHRSSQVSHPSVFCCLECIISLLRYLTEMSWRSEAKSFLPCFMETWPITMTLSTFRTPIPQRLVLWWGMNRCTLWVK